MTPVFDSALRERCHHSGKVAKDRYQGMGSGAFDASGRLTLRDTSCRVLWLKFLVWDGSVELQEVTIGGHRIETAPSHTFPGIFACIFPGFPLVAPPKNAKPSPTTNDPSRVGWTIEAHFQGPPGKTLSSSLLADEWDGTLDDLTRMMQS